MKGLVPCLKQIFKPLNCFCKEKLLENTRVIFIGVLHSPLLIGISFSKLKLLKSKGCKQMIEKVCNFKF
jgi:hypothetical protein